MAGRKEKWRGGKIHGREGLKWEVWKFCTVGGIRTGSDLVCMLATIFGRVKNLLKLWDLVFMMGLSDYFVVGDSEIWTLMCLASRENAWHVFN